MSRDAWARSGARRPSVAARPRDPRPAGSWGAAIERARAAWDGLTGGPSASVVEACYCEQGIGGTGPHGPTCVRRSVYSDAAAAAIVATALGLWADVAASMGEGAPED